MVKRYEKLEAMGQSRNQHLKDYTAAASSEYAFSCEDAGRRTLRSRHTTGGKVKGQNRVNFQWPAEDKRDPRGPNSSVGSGFG